MRQIRVSEVLPREIHAAQILALQIDAAQVVPEVELHQHLLP